jgi:hypothetical protein
MPWYFRFGIGPFRYSERITRTPREREQQRQQWQQRAAQQAYAAAKRQEAKEFDRELARNWEESTDTEKAVATYLNEHIRLGARPYGGPISGLTAEGDEVRFTVNCLGSGSLVDVGLPHPTSEMRALQDGDSVEVIISEEGRLVHLQHDWDNDGNPGMGVLASDLPGVPKEDEMRAVLERINRELFGDR